jgi:hypothetical protein
VGRFEEPPRDYVHWCEKFNLPPSCILPVSRTRTAGKIYEGDIVETVCDDGVRLSRFVVAYQETGGNFVKTRLGGERDVLSMDVISEARKEVIGNIFENPELLK